MFQKDSAGQYLQQKLPNGLTKHYRRRRVLGKGGFAKCYQVSDEKTGYRYACKAIQKESISNSKLKEKLQSQIDIHRKLVHKNIVRFESVFEDEKFIYIILQLCSNNTLNQLLKRRKVLSELQTRYYLLQLLHALLYLHQLKIVHRDLKLDNFFLGDNLDVKVGDLGLAAVLHHPRRTICGTPNYIAPQILDSRSGYSYQVDVWSIGIATYLMLYGRYPFEANDAKSAAARIGSKTYLINPSLSECAKSFISKMLQIRPCDRLTVKQLLNHQFLTHFDIPTSLPRSSLACPLNSNFLQQFKPKKTMKLQLPKQDEQFNFMLESRESPCSPRVKHSNVSQSMSASKILQLSRMQHLPYVFSQKKVGSFNLQSSQNGKQACMKGWVSRWWQFPKYGVLYVTTDNTLGVRFNDGTNIKSHPFPFKFTYIVDNKSKQISGNNIKRVADKDILSKLKSFQLMKQSAAITNDMNHEEGVSVRKYVRIEAMVILWLSNGNLQCRFADRTELIVSSQRSLFISSQKIRVLFDSKQISRQNAEIVQKQKKMAQTIKRIAKMGV